MSVRFLKVRIGGPEGEVRAFRGRFAWTLDKLIAAGETGITSLQNPAPRLSHYIFVLRKSGLVIDTQDERHHGDFAGTHGRYRLRTPVTVLEARQ